MYAVECHDMVFPKYAKLVFKINQAGNLSMSASPSRTPGKAPPGAVNGKLPKGTKVFDYDKEVITTITFSECLAIIDFIKTRRVMLTAEKANKVDLFKNSDNFEKKITFVYMADDNDPSIIKMATIYIDATIFGRNGAADTHIKFHLPLSLKSLEEIGEICKAYVSNVHTIKLIAGLQTQSEDKDRPYRNAGKPKASPSDIKAATSNYENIMED